MMKKTLKQHKLTWKMKFAKFSLFYANKRFANRGVIKINMTTMNITCSFASKVNRSGFKGCLDVYWKTRQKCWVWKYFLCCIQFFWMQERPDSSSRGWHSSLCCCVSAGLMTGSSSSGRPVPCSRWAQRGLFLWIHHVFLTTNINQMTENLAVMVSQWDK